jgi:hypothetical protein
MQNYNAQMSQASGLAQKRTADVTAFGQWYGQQQAALMAQEGTRQNNLQGLLGHLGSDASTTPQNGITSTIGTNMAPTAPGGAQQLAASGDNQAQSGILSTNALGNASETNSSQNELTALGGAYQQNMMTAVSSDLIKSQLAIGNEASKAYAQEGTAASKIDTNLTSYLNDRNKNAVSQNKNLLQSQYDIGRNTVAENKNILQSQYDTGQVNNRTLNELVNLAKTLPNVPPALADRIAQLSGAQPVTGTTVAGQKNLIDEQKLNQTAYENVTKRLAVGATTTKNKNTFIIDSIKNSIAQAEAGARVTVSNAEAKYYAQRAGLSVQEGKAALIRAVAYAQHYGSGSGAATLPGVTPLTTDAAASLMKQGSGYQSIFEKFDTGQPVKGVTNPPHGARATRNWINSNYGAGGTVTSSLMWAAYDMHYYKGLTPRTYQMLQALGFSKAQLANYKVVHPKKAP